MSGSRLKKMLDASPDMFLVINKEGVLVDFNPSRNFDPMIPPERFLHKPLKEVLPEELASAGLQRTREVLDSGKEGLLEYSLPVNGSSRFYEARFTHFDEGEVLVVVRDVTDRKASMLTARALMDASGDMSLLLDGEGRIIAINRTAAQVYGKIPAEMEGTLYWDHMPRDKVNLRRERIEEILVSGKSSTFVEFAGDRIFEVSCNPVTEPLEQVSCVALFIRDITERVASEQALIESEARYRRLYDENPVPMYIYDTDTLRILDVNAAMVKSYGYSKEELCAMTITDIRPSEDVSMVMENVTQLRSRQVYLGLWRHTKKDGTVIDVEITSGDFPFLDKPARLVLCNDVTEKHKIERDLAASEDKFKTVFKTSPISMSIHRGSDGYTVDVNDSFLEQTGFSREEVIGKTVFDYDVWEDIAKRDLFLEELGRFGVVAGMEANFRVKDGTIRHGLISARSIEIGGEPYHISIVRDITELKEIEAALLRSEEKFRSIVETTPMGIHMYRLDEGDRLVFSGANAAADAILEIDHERLVGLTIEEAFPGSGATEFPGRYREVCLSGKPWHNEQVHYADQDIQGDFEVYAFRTGHRSMSVLFSDITEKKRALAAIAESEEKFRTAFITSPDSVNINRLDNGAYVDINEGFTQIMGYGKADVIGRTSLDLGIWVDPEDRKRLVEGLQRCGYVNNLEAKFRARDGSVRDGLMSAKILNLKGEMHILSITRDITELKKTQEALLRSEEQLRASLEEKEILLKEIHHRVKNNLQVISGLLDLQAHHIDDPVGRALYKESQNRVVTMALIHEELYQSVNLGQVDFSDYVRNLSENLMISYGVDRDRIRLDIKAEKADMVVDTAIPCGLIINELITNALKHAFPGEITGTISLTFRQLRNKEYELTVCDDGVGMPRSVDIHHTSTLGMQLVTVLVGQLGGSLRVKRRKGTSFTIRFSEYHEAGSVLY